MINTEELYINLVNTPSDINEHLPILRHYASNCKHITEMGVRGVVSTIALAISKPDVLLSIDLYHPMNWNCGSNLDYVKEYCSKNKIDFKFILGSTLEMEIEETDFLFIDTLHTYEQLKSELSLHGNKAKKYIGLHDTTLYANKDENNTYTDKNMSGPIKGLWPAIEEFLANNKHWKIEERRTNNNGLTILKRD